MKAPVFGGLVLVLLTTTALNPVPSAARAMSAMEADLVQSAADRSSSSSIGAPSATSANGARSAPAGKSRHHTKGDPLEGLNRPLYKVNDFLDRTIFRPVAMVYKAIMPRIVRRGIRHFFHNLREPVNFVNDVLQLKPRRAARTLARFAVNSTWGIGGILDVGKKFNVPYKPNSLGNTMGRWGIGPGPYLFVPLMGPSDFRDLAGEAVDSRMMGWVFGKPFNKRYYNIPRTVLTGLDQRIRVDEDLQTLMRDAADPYATIRSVFLQSRKAEIDRLRNRDTDTNAGLESDLVDPAMDGGDANMGMSANSGANPGAGDLDASETGVGLRPEAPQPADPEVITNDPAISVGPTDGPDAPSELPDDPAGGQTTHGRGGNGMSASAVAPTTPRVLTVAYMVKLSPQPHAPLALGLANTNPAVKSSSTQFIVEPIR